MLTAERVKVAVIRQAGAPVGQPAPCYLNCPCGARPVVSDAERITCGCGAVYSPSGWLLAWRA
jgi:hypothetical protein